MATMNKKVGENAEAHAERRISELREEVAYHCNLYYNEATSVITDAAFDCLMGELKELERLHPHLITADSPTQVVGGTASESSFELVEHIVPMLSLDDKFSQDEVLAFLSKQPEGTTYRVEEKVDGLSVSAMYKFGTYVCGLTRGDGLIGEDITENLRLVSGIPSKIPVGQDVPLLVVRAEVYMPVEELERINAERDLEGKRLLANPRNAAAGLLRKKDTEAVKRAGLKAFAFNVQAVETMDTALAQRFQSHSDAMSILCDWGFDPVLGRTVAASGVLSVIEDIGQYRPSRAYWLDGAVVKVDDIALRKSLGETNKYPMWAIAYKYPAEEKETTITEIILQTGRTGRITPVAIFEPVLLNGTSVTRATLHNPAHVEKLDARVGSRATILKSGEIIPAVVAIDNSSLPAESTPFSMDACPECGEPIEVSEDKKSAKCVNEHCPAQFARYVTFFTSRPCMKIAGFGPAVVNACIEKGWLNNIADIYRLSEHREELAQLPGFGTRSADRLLAAIEGSKGNDIDRLIKALGIPGVGRHVGRILADRYPDMDAIMALTRETLEAVPDVGETLATALCQFFDTPKNRETVEDLRSLGVNMSSANYGKKAEGALLGLTFVITGTLSSMTRSDAKAFIEANGGKVSGSVSQKTNYLLAGESAGSKLEQARRLGVPVITEAELTEMLS